MSKEHQSEAEHSRMIPALSQDPDSYSHSFHLPPELNADRPPERRGLVRDRVRLLVLDRKTGATKHSRFDHLSEFLRPKDLLVFNSSRTLPAALIASGPQLDLEVRLAERLPDGSWMALLKGAEKENRIMPGLLLDFGLDLTAMVLSQDARIPALWRLRFSKSGTDFVDRLYRLGEPIRYRYLSSPWGLNYYQNVYGHRPGGSEMPSAGRAFSWRLLLNCVAWEWKQPASHFIQGFRPISTMRLIVSTLRPRKNIGLTRKPLKRSVEYERTAAG